MPEGLEKLYSPKSKKKRKKKSKETPQVVGRPGEFKKGGVRQKKAKRFKRGGLFARTR